MAGCVPAPEPVPDSVRYTLVVGSLESGEGYHAVLLADDGEAVGSGSDRNGGQGAALAAIRDSIDLVRMRPSSGRRGPDVLVLLSANDAVWWPQSNLHLDGCKHDIFVGDGDRVRAGKPTRCAKCQALMLAIVHVEGAARA